MIHKDISENERTSSWRTLWECFSSNSLFSVWYFSIRSRISLIFELFISEFSFKSRSTSSFDFISPSASWLLSSCTKNVCQSPVTSCGHNLKCDSHKVDDLVTLVSLNRGYKQQLVSVHYKINCESLDRLG